MSMISDPFAGDLSFEVDFFAGDFGFAANAADLDLIPDLAMTG
jgi:hypothetical protein